MKIVLMKDGDRAALLGSIDTGGEVPADVALPLDADDEVGGRKVSDYEDGVYPIPPDVAARLLATRPQPRRPGVL